MAQELRGYGGCILYRGYSLYELIIVIVIIAILSLTSLPLMITYLVKYHINSTFQQLQSVIKFAQNESVRRHSSDIMLCPANYNIDGILSGDNCAKADGQWGSGVISFIRFDHNKFYTSGRRIQAIFFVYNVIITMTYENSKINSLMLTHNGQIANIATNSEISLDFRQVWFGICRYSRYSLNRYGSVKLIVDNEPCS